MAGRLTEAQRKTLITSYINRGRDGTKPLCDQLGVSHDYPTELARKARISRGAKSLICRSRARMWDRAIANGPVTA